MQDEKDKATRDLFLSPGALRQAAYTTRMRASGYKQKTLWLKDSEIAAINELLEKLRKSK